MNKPFVIGVSGGSGSGKTFFLNELKKLFPSKDLCIICQDNYYRPKDQQQKDQNGIENFDLPTSIDDELFSRDLESLISGNQIIQEEYTFNNKDKKPRTYKLLPGKVILVEGIFIFHLQEISKLLNLKVYLDCLEHIKLSRRIIRDKEERGYDVEDVLYRYKNHVYPSFQKYIRPYKEMADIILPNNDDKNLSVEILESFIKNKLSQAKDASNFI